MLSLYRNVTDKQPSECWLKAPPMICDLNRPIPGSKFVDLTHIKISELLQPALNTCEAYLRPRRSHHVYAHGHIRICTCVHGTDAFLSSFYNQNTISYFAWHIISHYITSHNVVPHHQIPITSYQMCLFVWEDTSGRKAHHVRSHCTIPR